MNVYVETNFVLELAFMQEQHDNCEDILTLCETGNTHLVLPAFSIAESYETLIRRANTRKQIRDVLAKELQQLSRSKPYKDETEALRSIRSLLLRSTEDEEQRLNTVIDRLLSVADIIPLDANIFADAARFRVMFKLEPQDSIVYSSVSYHLTTANDAESCFINRDKHFADPDIEESLKEKGCKLLFSFDDGYRFIRYRAQHKTK